MDLDTYLKYVYYPVFIGLMLMVIGLLIIGIYNEQTIDNDEGTTSIRQEYSS